MAGVITFIVIFFGIPLGIALLFRKQRKLSAKIQKNLIEAGFSVDRFFFFDKEFLALDANQKKIAVGHYKSSEVQYINWSEVLKWRVNLGGKGSPDITSYVEIVTNNIQRPTHRVTLNSQKSAQECFDVLDAALNG